MMLWFGKKKAVPPAPPPKTSQDGVKRWFDEKGVLHREGGPAIVWPDGTQMWFKNGKRHRENGPAVEYPSGNVGWYLDGDKVEPFNKKLYKTKKQKREIKITPEFNANSHSQSSFAQVIRALLTEEIIHFKPSDRDESAQLQIKLFELGFKWEEGQQEVVHYAGNLTDGISLHKSGKFRTVNADRLSNNIRFGTVDDFLAENEDAFLTETGRMQRQIAALEKKVDMLINHLMPPDARHMTLPSAKPRQTAPSKKATP